MGILYLILGTACVFSLLAMLWTRHFMKALFLTALEGTAAFFAVNFIGGFFNVHLPLNLYTASFCALGGAPSVAALLFLQTIFHVL